MNCDGVCWGGLFVFYIDGIRINFDWLLIVSFDWMYWDVKMMMFFVDLKYILFNDVSLNVLYLYRKEDLFLNLLYIIG